MDSIKRKKILLLICLLGAFLIGIMMTVFASGLIITDNNYRDPCGTRGEGFNCLTPIPQKYEYRADAETLLVVGGIVTSVSGIFAYKVAKSVKEVKQPNSQN